MSIAQQLAKKANEVKNGLSTPPVDLKLDKEEQIQRVIKTLATVIVAPKGSYLAKRQTKLILASGASVFPTNGFYIPKSQEELDLLEYFNAQQAGLVERVEDGEDIRDILVASGVLDEESEKKE